MSYLKRLILIFYLFVITFSGFCQDYYENLHNDIKFIQNKGQWEQNVLYRANIPDGFLFLENKGLTYLFYDGEAYDNMKHNYANPTVIDFHTIKASFLNANSKPAVVPIQQTKEYYNFFLGNDRSKWASGAKGYFDVKYEGIYPGIDAVISGIECQLEYSFYLKPKADPGKIKIFYEGVEDIFIREGDLHVVSSVASFVEYKPMAYSVVEGIKKEVPCVFVLNGNILGYDFPQGYDPNYPLVIDPIVIFSTFSGSIADNFGYTATYDDSGYAYSGGTVFDQGFPTTPGAFQDTFAGGVPGQPYSGDGRDIGILKYSPDGKKLIYCTYIGGRGNDDPHSLVVNSNYELVIFGNTCSDNFPIGQHFWDSSYNKNYDIYIAKLSVDGKQLLASTYVGGDSADALNGFFVSDFYNISTLGWNYGDVFRGEVIVDSSDNIYVVTTTKSRNFPVTSSSFQPLFGGGMQDACVIKMSPDLDTLLKSTYAGGKYDDAGYGIALDGNNDIYICGGTKSTNLPVQPGKYQTTYQGDPADGFIYKISADFSSLLTSTYVGTSAYDQTYCIQTDQNNNVYVTGQTKSNSFPVKNVKYSNLKGKQFIVKFKPLLDSIIYSSVFGSGRADPDLSPSAFLVDNCERVYFSGWGGATNWFSHNKGNTKNLPTTPDAFQKTTDSSDFYLAVFAKNFDALLYGTYFGGPVSHEHVDGGTSRFDKKGVVYQSVCAGCGGHSDFPTYPKPGVWSNTNKSWNCNNALFKLDLNIPDVFADFKVDTIDCLAQATKITNTSIGGLTYLWDFGDGDTSSAFEPKHLYSDTGTYKIKLIVRNIFSCTTADTIIKPVVVHTNANTGFAFDTSRCVNNIAFKVTSEWGSTFRWDFGDNSYSKMKNPVHGYKRDTGTYKVTLYVDSGAVCEVKVAKNVKVSDLPEAHFTYTIDTCRGRLMFNNLSIRSKSWLWDFGDAQSSTLKDPVHDYLSAGNFGIILYAEPGTVCADTAFGSVEIKVPRANAIVTLDSCNFDAVLINPSTYVLNKSIWYFGDGDSLYYADTAMHRYPAPGTYTIKLIANTGTICEDTVSKNIMIPELPVAGFEYDRQQCSPFVLFKNHSAYSVSYNWIFSTGFTTNKSDSFVYKFDSTGNYIVMLISTSQATCSDTLIDTVFIDHLALAGFNFAMDTCNSEVSFNNLSTRSGSSLWDFGDQKQSTTRSPVHVYDTTGSFLVTLVVQDGPCMDTISKPVNIFDSEPITFECFYDSCSTKINLKPSRYNAIKYNWFLGDGATSSQKNVIHFYKNSGNYTITLVINKDTICPDSISKEVSMFRYETKNIDVPNVFTPNSDSQNDVFTIRGLDNRCDIYKLWIYNRWGQLIFESLPDIIEWDGRTEGLLVSPGTYIYILKGNSFEMSGTVTVSY